MSEDKKIEFSGSEVLNALLHRHGFDQHFATQESVDNVKERLTRFEDQMDKQFGHVHETINEFKGLTDKRFDSVDKRFDLVDKRFEQVNESINELKLSLEKRLDKIESTNTKLLFLIIGLFFAGFSALYFK